MNPLLQRWRTTQPDVTGLPLAQSLLYPLVFEPGTRFEYGASLDWTGELVSRLNGTSLQEYMQTHIWAPLGIKDMTFHLEQRPDMRARLAPMGIRAGGSHPLFMISLNPDGKIDWAPESDRFMFFQDPIPDEQGGIGAYASAPDYFKVVQSIGRNDGQLLRPETVEEMFKPQLSEEARTTLMQALAIKEVNALFGGLPMGMEVSWGLGGLLNLDDFPTGRARGSMSWGGMPNSGWWIDRNGIFGFYAGHVLPPGDPKSHVMYREFETAMYERFHRANRRS
jgi:CubicO group peptidase (beta-lactamase class C family)